MRDLFPGFYRPSEEEFHRVWQEGIFVLDTNVLLNLYRYPEEARNEFLNLMRNISNRLWIPNQVGLEFQRNRLSVIAEQLQKYGEVRKIIGEAESSLLGKLGQLQLKKRHSYIQHEDFVAKASSLFKEFLGELDQLEQKQPDLFSEDTIRREIDSLLNGNVGEPLTEQELDDLYKVGPARYGVHEPPGYSDSSKGKNSVADAYVYRGLTFKKEFGDLILWNELIKEATLRKWAHVVLITDDEKEDWWWTIDSKGRRTIGPRPELVAEIGDKAGVRSFYMYTSERFIEHAGRYLNLRVRPETLSQVRDVADVRRQEDESKPRISVSSALGAVMAYLSRVKPEYQFALSAIDTVFDLIGTKLTTGALIGVEVRYSSMFTRRMFDRITTRVFDYAQNETSFEEIIIIFAHEGNRHVDRTIRAIQSLSNIPPKVTFLVGVISIEDGSPLFVARYQPQ